MSVVSSKKLKQALDDIRRENHIVDLESPTANGVVFARVITLLMVKETESRIAPDLINKLLRQRQTDHLCELDTVVVIGIESEADSVVIGSHSLEFLLPTGISGILLDGVFEDTCTLTDTIPVWHRGYSNNATLQPFVPVWINQPLQICGVSIAPGDFVFTDRDGTLVIPAQDVDRVIDQVLIDSTPMASSTVSKNISS